MSDPTILTYILMPIGLLLLFKGGELLVRGASSLARRMNIPDIAIGLTVVAWGTSMPEFFVNVIAVVHGTPDIAVGNIVGSNIANVFLILGLSALIRPLAVSHGTVFKEIPFSLLAAVVLYLLASDWLIDRQPAGALTRSDGLVLLAIFPVFLYYTFGIARQSRDQEMELDRPQDRLGHSLARLALGLAGLMVGGEWIVNGAVALALLMGMSQSLVGLTLVAIGTSLPELATSLMAAKRGYLDIAVGNVVGSNIFNTFVILGLSSTLTPLPVSPAMMVDLGVVVLSGMVLFGFMFTGTRHAVDRWEGVGLLLLYAAYVTFTILRG